MPALGSRPGHVPAPVRDFGYASPTNPRPVGNYESLPQLTVLATARDDPGDWLPQIIIRFGYGPPGAETPRRPVADTVDRSATVIRPARQQ